MASCSDSNQLVEDPSPHIGYDNPNETGPWTMAEDDNRTRLGHCGLQVFSQVSNTNIRAHWAEPANLYDQSESTLEELSGNEENATQNEIASDENASLEPLVKPLYRLEVAEDEGFTKSYRSFPDINGTSFEIKELEPFTSYFVRLQAYFESMEDPFAPSEPEIATTTTGARLFPPANFKVTVEYGKFSLSWEPPAGAEGKFEYLVRLYKEGGGENPIEHRNTKVPFIKDWPAKPETNYTVELLTWTDPDTTNEVLTYPSIIEYFTVPGHKLDIPKNFSARRDGNNINLSWDRIDNNLNDFEYLINIYLDGNRSEDLGTHYLDDPEFTMTEVQEFPRYWFDLQAVPSRTNKVDTASEIISSSIDLPTMTYAVPTIKSVKLEPVTDSDIAESTIILAWEGSANEDGKQTYWIEFAEDPEFTKGFQDHEADIGTLEAEVGPFEQGAILYYRMIARGPNKDATRIESEWTEVKKIVIP